MNVAIGVTVAAGVVLIIWGVVIYNQLVDLRNRAREAWSGIDVQLTRRHDLVANLVATVKGYAAHERQALEEVTRYRSEAIGATGPRDQAQAQERLQGALKLLFAVAENYPDLKADQQFLSLQKNLTEIEDALQYARRYYNGVVRDFNNKVFMLPSNLIAGVFGFRRLEYFEAHGEDRETPDVGGGLSAPPSEEGR
jgi:LemA protein